MRSSVCLIEHQIKSFMLSVETLLEENWLVVTEKYDFEFQHKSMRKTFRFLGLPGR